MREVAYNPERYRQYLRPNHGNQIPHDWVFVETVAAGDRYQGAQDFTLMRLKWAIAHRCRIEKGKIKRWQRIITNDPRNFWAWLNEFWQKDRALWLCGFKIGQSVTLLDLWGKSRGGIKRAARVTCG